ncbi:MAG: pentapeptide repeat-containing protein [Microthrixaceae bacterium]
MEPAAPDVDWNECRKNAADLTDADLANANLVRTNLAGANLTGATLTNATMFDTNVTDANLTSAYWLTGGPVLAIGTPANVSGIIYDNTTCPNQTVVTSPGTCW